MYTITLQREFCHNNDRNRLLVQGTGCPVVVAGQRSKGRRFLLPHLHRTIPSTARPILIYILPNVYFVVHLEIRIKKTFPRVQPLKP